MGAITFLAIVGAIVVILCVLCCVCCPGSKKKDDIPETTGTRMVTITNVTYERTPSRRIPDVQIHEPPYPLTDPVGMPAPPQGYLTSNIPINTITLSHIPPTTRTTATRRTQEETTTSSSDLPPSYSEVMLNT